MTENSAIQQWVKNVLGVRFDESVAITNRLWLRKEIIKQDRNIDIAVA